MSLQTRITSAFQRVAQEINAFRNSLSAVATSGSYSDLTGKPVIGNGGLTEKNFTSALQSKLEAIEESATADQSAAEIESLLNAHLGQSNWKTGGTGVAVNSSWMKRSSTSTQTITDVKTAINFDAQIVDNTTSDISFTGGKFVAIENGSYRFGGFVTVQNTTDQRFQFAVEIFINGVATGYFRTSSYIRNSGSSWDYWVAEIAGEPLALSAGDQVDLRIFQVTGNTYTAAGSLTSGSLVGDKSVAWFERMSGDQGPQGEKGDLNPNGIDSVARANIAYMLMSDLMSSTAMTTNLPNGLIEKASALTLSEGRMDDGFISSKYITSGTTQLVPQMSGATNGSITISSSSQYSGSYPAWAAFNRTPAHWGGASPFTNPEYLRVDFGVTTVFSKFSLTGFTNPIYNPTDFIIQGSHDEITWNDLLSVSDVTDWTASEVKEWDVFGSYRYVQILISAINGGSNVAAAEAQFYSGTVVLGNLQAETSEIAAMSPPSTAKVYALIEGGTSSDISLELSNDSGLTFAAGANLSKLIDVGSLTLWSADVAISGSGTAMIARCKTANNADIKLHDLGVLWD